MRRHLLGILAIVLLIAGPLWLWREPNNFLAASCLRIGAVLGALWLALPQLKTMPIWLYATVVGSFILIARWPKLAWVIVPAVIAMWILKPRAGGQAKMKSSTPVRRE